MTPKGFFAASAVAPMIGPFYAKLLLDIGDPLIGRLLAYDALEQSFRAFKVRRDPNCPACGEHAAPILKLSEHPLVRGPHRRRPPP